MIKFLAIQSTYNHLQFALFSDSELLHLTEIDKFHASKLCIVALQGLLQKEALSFNQLKFIAVNQGPGPFTTLRTAISMVNGLSFAIKIPLIGINGLQAFADEYHHHAAAIKIFLLNAFGFDVYYLIQHKSDIKQGCMNIDMLVQEINQSYSNESILFLGNGVDRYKESLVGAVSDRAIFIEPNPQTVSINQIGISGLQAWQSQAIISNELQPLYFKSAF